MSLMMIIITMTMMMSWWWWCRRRRRCFLRQIELRFTPAIELLGDQLGELGRDVCHRVFCSTEAASRAEQGADFAESFVRRLVHNGDELVTRQECRKLFVGDALSLETAQQRRGHQYDPDSRLRQTPVDFAEQRRAEGDVLLAEPDPDTA